MAERLESHEQLRRELGASRAQRTHGNAIGCRGDRLLLRSPGWSTVARQRGACTRLLAWQNTATAQVTASEDVRPKKMFRARTFTANENLAGFVAISSPRIRDVTTGSGAVPWTAFRGLPTRGHPRQSRRCWWHVHDLAPSQMVDRMALAVRSQYRGILRAPAS